MASTPVVDKGRVDPEEMTDRELLIECVRNQRQMLDTVQSFVDSMQKNPMLKMMAGKFGA